MCIRDSVGTLYLNRSSLLLRDTLHRELPPKHLSLLSLIHIYTLGNFKTYSPFEGSIFGVPSSGQSMAINASLSQTLEMKVLSKRDTSGMKKIKLIDELRIGQVSYNFLADSMGLSNIPISLRTTVFQNFGININATLDPYRVTPQGQRINKLFFPGRVVSASTSFGYTFQSRPVSYTHLSSLAFFKISERSCRMRESWSA